LSQVKASFYGWLAFSLFVIGRTKDSYQYGLAALKLGQESGSYAAISLAYSNLIWDCAELKLLDQGIQYGEQALAKREDFEPMAYFISLGGLGMIYIFKGDSQKNFELARILLEFGESHSDLRSMVVGYICMSFGYQSAGDFAQAMEWSKKAIELSNDPLFSVWPKLIHVNYYLYAEQYQEAEEILREIIPFCQHLGLDYVTVWAQALYGAVLVTQGQFSRGLKMITEGVRVFNRNGRFLSLYWVEFTLAEIYFQMATRSRRLGFWPTVKNLGFLLKEVPLARRKAEAYLNKIIQVGQEIGAGGFMQSHAASRLELLHQLKGPKKPGG
jgi:tetratricopeptide (TPR) repeat protein